MKVKKIKEENVESVMKNLIMKCDDTNIVILAQLFRLVNKLTDENIKNQ